MKKIKKVLKIIFLCVVVLGFAAILSGVGYYYAVTFSVSLEKDKLENLESCGIEIYDRNNIKILPGNQMYTKVTNLSKDTVNAFICAEDKRFFSHHGIDYIRVFSAIKNNLKTKSFSQGASTISQQLIKNTHLSSEKTIKRKLKEIKLTRQLEKNYSKNEILEMYLNNIYFGNGCYGIENASMHYFAKPASALTLSESALLAGTINAPSLYDIQGENENALERRNLILGLMKKNGKISSKQYDEAKNEKINLNLTKINSNSFVYNEILNEACKHLGKTENELKNNNIKIYTYYDTKLAENIHEKITNNFELGDGIAPACIVANNKTGGILCAIGGKTLNENHQPGSVIKPILVYAPAIEKGIVSPATKILDEKIDIGGYSPENADKTYHGFVSVRESLSNSYNIPAVKLLNEIGIQDAQDFAKNLGVRFSEKDNNLAIALGGLTEGNTLKDICQAYMTFSNIGNYKKTQYISKITQKDKQIYQNKENFKKVMKDSTSYLITDMLVSCSKSGTAKRLKNLNYQVASKTGTVGKSGSSKNTDAYNVSYTTEHTIAAYFGGSDMSEKINGATYPTMLSKEILDLLYKDHIPQNFEKPSSVVSKSISKPEYEKGNIVLSTDKANSFYEVFSKDNLPKTKSIDFDYKIQVFNFEDKKPIICFNVPKNVSYKIIRRDENAEEIISSATTNNDEIIKFEDKMAKTNAIYEYFAEFCVFSTNKTVKSNMIKLKAF